METIFLDALYCSLYSGLSADPNRLSHYIRYRCYISELKVFRKQTMSKFTQKYIV